MKGVVFNLLEDFITQGWDEDTLDDIMEMCPLHTQEPFVGPKTYPDADMFAIVDVACRRLSLTQSEALFAFGVYCFPHLAASVPEFMNGHAGARAFLRTVHDVIHVEVNKLMEGSILPDFVYHDAPDGALLIEYHSRRKMPDFMAGLIAGTARHFDETIAASYAPHTDGGREYHLFTLYFGDERADA